MNKTLKDLLKVVTKFRDDRDWKQFHNPKDIALSLNVESSELLEHFLWKNGEQLEAYLKKHKKDVAYELSDVLNHVLLLANEMDINLEEAFLKKMKINEKKYPIRKARGKNKKYTEL